MTELQKDMLMLQKMMNNIQFSQGFLGQSSIYVFIQIMIASYHL